MKNILSKERDRSFPLGWLTTARRTLKAISTPSKLPCLLFIMAIPFFASFASDIGFTTTGSMTAPRYGFTLTLLPNGKVLAVGGSSNSDGVMSSAELYDPGTRTWLATGAMNIPRMWHTATLLSNGKVLVVAGGDSVLYASAELFDPQTETWELTGSTSIPRFLHTATLLPNGKVLIVGGAYDTWEINNQLASAELYDPETGTWSTTGSLNQGRYYHAATLLPSGEVLISGGSSAGNNYFNSAEIYNPTAGTWTNTQSLAIARHTHTATMLPNGRVLVAGGRSSGGPLSSAELYDALTKTWTSTSDLNAPARADHTAKLLPNGMVLVAGGRDGSGPTISSAELYNPDNGQWLPVGGLIQHRCNHQPVLLPDGCLLITGGYSTATMTHLSSSELYGLKITFEATGGTVSPTSKTYYLDTDTCGQLPVPQRTGYLFTGWWTNAEYTGSAITSASTVTLISAHTLYAKWTLDPYYVAGGSDATPIGVTNAVDSDIANSGDGLNSLKLGGIGLLADGQMAGIEWSATGPGILVFDWKVSSEANWDWLSFFELGKSPTNQISGNINWTRMSVTVTGALDVAHTFRWEYEKDPIGDYVGQDCGWVDAISWTPFRQMTVNNGSGDGLYTNNTQVSITADAPVAHYEFDRWTGDTNTVANISSASTTLAMPSTNITVTATYKPILYTLNVSSGTGGGSYSYASSVEIRASDIANKIFYRWTGDVGSVADVNAATTTVLTSDQTIALTATYSVPLTVNSGTGSGWYPEGSTTTVSADADPMWKEFAVWTGDAGLLSNANARTTTLTLPTAPATVTATYRDSVARLTGSYGRTYGESGTTGAITPDATAGSPSGTPAVKLGGTGVIPDGGFAAFETVVSGSGTIFFSWKVSSELNADYLKFKVDGVVSNQISGTKGPWTSVTNRVEGTGDHTLRWEYVKDGGNASSTDAGWVDDIVWVGDEQYPSLEPVIVNAVLTNQNMAIEFTGERGITYLIQTNGTLDHSGWSDFQALQPTWVNESNGVHRFEIVPPASAPDKLFYRISTPQPTYMIIDLSSGPASGSYPVSYLMNIPAGGWTDEYKTTKLVLRLVPKGKFTMGSPLDELGRQTDEIQHEVTLTSDFYMGVFEVTQRQWELVMGNKPSYFTNATYYATRPVEMVSYYDIRENPANSDDPAVNWPSNSNVNANSFIGKLHTKTGLSTFDLPTEAQWEYACRAGTTTALNSGKNQTGTTICANTAEVGRYRYNGGYVGGTTLPAQGCTTANGTAKAGSYLPNALGLYDMHANVWELCLDWYGAYTGNAEDPLGSVSGTIRVERGACWYSVAQSCSSASRFSCSPSIRNFTIGFRLSSALP
jgi:uncharacterized repeat protein (TIGR02543 family)